MIKPYYENDYGKLYLGDCVEVMKELDRESIDLVLTDPAYKVISGGKYEWYKGSIIEENDGKIFKHNDIKFEEWLPLIYKLLKERTHCYIMSNVLNLKELLIKTEQEGFKLHNLLIWEKNNTLPSRWYLKNGEYILFLRKGKAKKINNVKSKTVHPFHNIHKERLHPTEKNIDHFKFLLTNSTDPGDIVLDPFSGSGTTAVACMKAKRRFILIEKDEEYCNKSIRKIELHSKQLSLFETIGEA